MDHRRVSPSTRCHHEYVAVVGLMMDSTSHWVTIMAQLRYGARYELTMATAVSRDTVIVEW